ncbi:MAG: glutamate synthase large subunit [Acidobacteria bacterium]|nr:glutamate synthase large subunit [Acidobacteriota bacterium]
MWNQEKSSCGVGFVASLHQVSNHENLQQALHALRCVEHRGACGADLETSDGAGVMTDIPFELLGFEKHSVGVAQLFLPQDEPYRKEILAIFEDTFAFLDVELIGYREVPINAEVLGPQARQTMPVLVQAFLRRPVHCTTVDSFNKLLYIGKQHARTRVIRRFSNYEVFFSSISAETIVYKALVRSEKLDQFYLDLQSPQYRTRFALFHRRFSTNTSTAWDKAQPFRLIAHNGEINTIAGNRSWAYSREKTLGLQANELITHHGISDSGSLNEMVEALRYRSHLANINDILAIMMPPADRQNDYYTFWARTMEPWDGPAIILFSDGNLVGARLDRNGFRPGRWMLTEGHFYVCSEAGAFALNESDIRFKGALHAGNAVTVNLRTGLVSFEDPSTIAAYQGVRFDPRLVSLPATTQLQAAGMADKTVFGYTEEDSNRILLPMMATGKEPIGSMGDTARLAVLSDEPRSFFDFFYQDFAQVTNPPVDYLRETIATDLTVFLGSKPNIFIPTELIPPRPAIRLEHPVLSLQQISELKALTTDHSQEVGIRAVVLDTTFDATEGVAGFDLAIDELTRKGLTAVEHGTAVVILSDRQAGHHRLPIPSLLALRALVNALNESGLKLKASLVVESGEIRSSHHVAALIGFGATAVCPYLALEIARFEPNAKLEGIAPEQREANLIAALRSGLLKIMAKMGISVLRSYQNARLFTILGLGRNLVNFYFPGMESVVGGFELEHIVDLVRLNATRSEAAMAVGSGKLLHTYQFREHTQGTAGEKHAMTTTRARMIHKLVRETGHSLSSPELYDHYLKQGEDSAPVTFRHLFRLKTELPALGLNQVEPMSDILWRFGTGGMSFGAISAESQRDLITAMREVRARSNSGEGGENPFYFAEGITATTKQVASGRFGVTAEYLISAQEIQIKIAQGAKPGEGGQLMAVKVTPEIARARHSPVNIDLISPPPMHDIYSIEDLKELIYELKQLHPSAKVSVKLVSGVNIDTIAVGVAKAGADIIHISGGDGGTGAAGLGSMKHAGLPWELGLVAVHRALVANHLRQSITLRVDGGLHTGKDLVLAAALGAEEFDFGKLLLVAEGCIMARICETNRCPAGIATHDPKFKAKYQGTPTHVVRMLEYLAEDVRRHLARLGFTTLTDLVGRIDLVETDPRFTQLVAERNLDLSFFFQTVLSGSKAAFDLTTSLAYVPVSPLNEFLVNRAKPALDHQTPFRIECGIRSTDRAALATLSGVIAETMYHQRGHSEPGTQPPATNRIQVDFVGSAGQGFGVFLVDGIETRLFGEANDSVCKGMSGGKVVIRPHPHSKLEPEKNTIIGNCALYGATGGKLFINGLAGDRFAVRNSGALAVVEGVGLHACEYMTNGIVVILGKIGLNLGAGMTGGKIYLHSQPDLSRINQNYVQLQQLTNQDADELVHLLGEYAAETDSLRAQAMVRSFATLRAEFWKIIPGKA